MTDRGGLKAIIMRKQSLTNQEKELIPIVRNQWVNQLSKPIDKEKAEKGVKWLYRIAKLKEPKVLFFSSPLALQIAANIFKCNSSVESAVESAVRSEVRSAVRSEVWSAVWSEVRSEVESAVRSAVGSEVRSAVRSEVESAVWSEVESAVRSAVWSEVRSEVESAVKLKFFDFPYYGNISDFGWVSYRDYFSRIGVLKNSNFDKFKNLMQSGVYDMIQLDRLCLVAENPKELHRDNNKRLNSAYGPAIAWNDGYYLNFWHGVNIPRNIFNEVKGKSLKIEQFLKIENEEVKAAVLDITQEIHGPEYLGLWLSEKLDKIDTYIDKKPKNYLVGTTGGMNIGVYDLFVGTISGIKLSFVRCYCPSTDRMFFLQTEPRFTKAHNAIASLSRPPKKIKPHIEYIMRQGEEFTAYLTPEGEDIAKTLTESELNDREAFTGKEYFELMTYEY